LYHDKKPEPVKMILIEIGHQNSLHKPEPECFTRERDDRAEIVVQMRIGD